jgi:hypothetical protein
MAAPHEKAGGGNPRQHFQTFNKTSFNTPRAAIKAAIFRSLPDRPDSVDDLGGWVQLGSPVDAVMTAMKAKMAEAGRS